MPSRKSNNSRKEKKDTMKRRAKRAEQKARLEAKLLDKRAEQKAKLEAKLLDLQNNLAEAPLGARQLVRLVYKLLLLAARDPAARDEVAAPARGAIAAMACSDHATELQMLNRVLDVLRANDLARLVRVLKANTGGGEPLDEAVPGILEAFGSMQPQLSPGLYERLLHAAASSTAALPAGAAGLLEQLVRGWGGLPAAAAAAAGPQHLVQLFESLATGDKPDPAAHVCTTLATLAACPGGLDAGLAGLFFASAASALARGKDNVDAVASICVAVDAVVDQRQYRVPDKLRDDLVDAAVDAVDSLTDGPAGGKIDMAQSFQRLVLDLVAADSTDECLAAAGGQDNCTDSLLRVFLPLLRRSAEWSDEETHAQTRVFVLRENLLKHRRTAQVMECWYREVRPALVETVRGGAAPAGYECVQHLTEAVDNAIDRIEEARVKSVAGSPPRRPRTPPKAGRRRRMRQRQDAAARSPSNSDCGSEEQRRPEVALVFANDNLPSTEGKLQEHVFNARLNIDVFARKGGYGDLPENQHEQCGPGRFALRRCAHRTYRFNKGLGHARLCGRMLRCQNGDLMFRVLAHGDHTEVEYLVKGILGIKLDTYNRKEGQAKHEMRREAAKKLPKAPEFESVPFENLKAYLKAENCRAADHYGTHEEFGDPQDVRVQYY